MSFFTCFTVKSVLIIGPFSCIQSVPPKFTRNHVYRAKIDDKIVWLVYKYIIFFIFLIFVHLLGS